MSYVQLNGISDWMGNLLGKVSGSVSAPTQPEILALQTAINDQLKKKGCSVIGTDGVAGGQTCGALKYITEQGMSVDPPLASAAAAVGASCTKYNYTCSGAGTAVATTTPSSVVPSPAFQLAMERKWYQDPVTVTMISAGAVAVGLVAYAAMAGRKKGK